MKNIFLVIFLFFLFFVLGCGKKEDKTNVNNKTEDVKISDVSSKKDDIKKNSNDSSINKMPDHVPSDFPLYKNYRITSSSKTDSNTTFIFEIDDNIRAVSEFYKSEMLKQGYKAEKGNDIAINNKGGIITFTKDNKEYELKFRYSDAAGYTILILTIR